MAAQAWPPPKAFLLPRVPTCRICPPWNRHPQPPNPTSGPLHGLQWLKKVARHLRHLLPIPMKACLAEEMPRKVQKVKPSLWGRLALAGPAKKLGTTGPGFWDGSVLSAPWAWMWWWPVGQGFQCFLKWDSRSRWDECVSLLWYNLYHHHHPAPFSISRASSLPRN